MRQYYNSGTVPVHVGEYSVDHINLYSIENLKHILMLWFVSQLKVINTYILYPYKEHDAVSVTVQKVDILDQDESLIVFH